MKKLIIVLFMLSMGLGVELLTVAEHTFPSEIKYITSLELESKEVIFIQTENGIIIEGIGIPGNYFPFEYREVIPVAKSDSVFVFYREINETSFGKVKWRKIFPEYGSCDSMLLAMVDTIPFAIHYFDEHGFVLGYDNSLYYAEYGALLFSFEYDYRIYKFLKAENGDIYINFFTRSKGDYGTYQYYRLDDYMIEFTPFCFPDYEMIDVHEYRSSIERWTRYETTEFNTFYLALNRSRLDVSEAISPTYLEERHHYGWSTSDFMHYSRWSRTTYHIRFNSTEIFEIDELPLRNPLVGYFRYEDQEIILGDILFSGIDVVPIIGIADSFYESSIVNYIFPEPIHDDIFPRMLHYPLNNIIVDIDGNGFDEIAVCDGHNFKLYSFYELESSSVTESNGVPQVFSITAYPNPFNSTIKLDFCGGAVITITDVSGKIIDRLATGARTWQPVESIESGVYFINGNIDGQRFTKRIVYMK